MQFIRANDVARLIGVSKVTLWRMVRAGRFPAPVTVNDNSKAYVLEEVQEWMAAAVSRRPVRRTRGARAGPGDHHLPGATPAGRPRADARQRVR